MTLPSRSRTVVVFACCAVAAYALCNLEQSTPPVGVMVGALFLLTTPLLNRMKSLAPQILVRAVWWQAAFVGVLFAAGAASGTAPLLTLGCVGALLAAGRVGLDGESATFAPTTFRRTLMASLIFGVADLIALAVYSTVWVQYAFEKSGDVTTYLGQGALFVGAAAAMSVAVVGLFRLKMWGLVACVGANVVIAALAWTGAFGLREFLAVGLACTALLQLLIPLPLIRGMWQARGRRLRA